MSDESAELFKDRERLFEENRRLRVALSQLLAEVLVEGFGFSKDYNWPMAIADASSAINGSEGISK